MVCKKDIAPPGDRRCEFQTNDGAEIFSVPVKQKTEKHFNRKKQKSIRKII